MSKTARPSLRASLPPVADEAAEAAARAQEMLRRQTTRPATPEELTPVAMTTSTIHLPVELLGALRAAANRRADRKMRDNPRGRGGRPSVSEIVVELLTKHRDELNQMN
jgi:hypothetical protein